MFDLAVDAGWRCHGGTLLTETNAVTDLLAEPGHALGARFEHGDEVVGVHVYTFEGGLSAQLTLPLGASEHCRALLEAVGDTVGVPIGIVWPGAHADA